jgi:hypothetical protein
VAQKQDVRVGELGLYPIRNSRILQVKLIVCRDAESTNLDNKSTSLVFMLCDAPTWMAVHGSSVIEGLRYSFGRKTGCN